MKKSHFSFGILALLALSSLAHADGTWLGDVRVHLVHRGEVFDTAFNGQPIVDNLADYNTFSVYFEYYKVRVTDTPGVSIWQNIDAELQLIQDDTQKIISKGTPLVTGQDGNNAVYMIWLDAINPQTVSGMDPELANRQTMKTHLNVYMDGVEALSIPINYSYSP